MQVINGQMVYGKKDCWVCDNSEHPGFLAGRIKCGTCNGTGKGKRGGRNGCQTCRGLRTQHSNAPEHRVVCSNCNGNYRLFSDENNCDHVPVEILQTVRFKVYRHKRALTGNEAMLGEGCVWSSVDYGTAWDRAESIGVEAADAELIAKVQKEFTFVQATKLTKRDGTFCNHVGIFVAPGGYSLRPVFEDVNAVLLQIANERPEAEYMAVGTAIAEAGGNGTVGALYRS